MNFSAELLFLNIFRSLASAMSEDMPSTKRLLHTGRGILKSSTTILRLEGRGSAKGNVHTQHEATMKILGEFAQCCFA